MRRHHLQGDRMPTYEPYRHRGNSLSSSTTNEKGHFMRGSRSPHHHGNGFLGPGIRMYQGRNGYSSSDNASIGSQDEYPEYLLEHLATFAVSPETGVVYPADGMRRLLTLEKTHGIWTQKILMRLERRWVVMVDKENG
ncbi:unnamed protein product, partial [Cyprideis torosa]